jgi:3-oxoacyl-[acyl-carrier-protein] synthase-1
MDAVVVAAGMITPIGLSLAQTAAAARARVARLRAIERVDRRFEPYIVGSVPEDALPPLAPDLEPSVQGREARLLRLAHAALEEALAQVPADAGPIPVLLGLPEHHAPTPIEEGRFLQRLAHQSGVALDLTRSMAASCGRAAGAMALKQAIARLGRAESDFVLVGGVDSLVDPLILDELDRQERIRGETNGDGFSPSEGAAFLLLTSSTRAQQDGLAVLARLAGAAIGREPGHLYASAPYLGDGLAATFSELLQSQAPSVPIACVYASFNGERYWAREFGTARLRNAAFFDEDLQIEHPAECLGDLGAALGPALVALAAHGLAGEYRRAPCLAFASSDRGERAAVLLEAAPRALAN